MKRSPPPASRIVYRFYNRETGQAIADYVDGAWRRRSTTRQPITIFDPVATWKKKTVTQLHGAQEHRVTQVFDKGESASTSCPSLAATSAITAPTRWTHLWDEVKRFEHPHRYYVDLSDRLWNERNDLLERINAE